MPETPALVDRAIELATSGTCISVNDIRQRLRREGYEGVGTELAGMEINRNLIALIHASRR